MRGLKENILEKLNLDDVRLNPKFIPNELDSIVAMFVDEYGCNDTNDDKTRLMSDEFVMKYNPKRKNLLIRGNLDKANKFLRKQNKNIKDCCRLSSHPAYSNKDIVYVLEMDGLYDILNNVQLYKFLNDFYNNFK